MAEVTGISWADSTLNPWIGCTAVSPACDNCYAEQLATARLGVGWGPHAERRRTKPQTWNAARRWNREAAASGRRHIVFCASLADVFDNAVPEEWRTDLWSLIADTPALTWMLLTKRPQNIPNMLPEGWSDGAWPNVWLGTTVENDEEARRRIPALLKVQATLHFLSMEPLLGPVDITPWLIGQEEAGMVGNAVGWTPPIGLVIAGGESGAKARPAHPAWFRDLRDQCARAGVPFHFKQWGEWAPLSAFGATFARPARGEGDARYLVGAKDWNRYVDGHDCGGGEMLYRAGVRHTGHLLDGVEHRAMPDV